MERKEESIEDEDNVLALCGAHLAFSVIWTTAKTGERGVTGVYEGQLNAQCYEVNEQQVISAFLMTEKEQKQDQEQEQASTTIIKMKGTIDWRLIRADKEGMQIYEQVPNETTEPVVGWFCVRSRQLFLRGTTLLPGAIFGNPFEYKMQLSSTGEHLSGLSRGAGSLVAWHSPIHGTPIPALNRTPLQFPSIAALLLSLFNLRASNQGKPESPI